MTPNPEAKRRALQRLMVNSVGGPPAVSLTSDDLTSLVPPMPQEEQEGVATRSIPVSQVVEYVDPGAAESVSAATDPIQEELDRLRAKEAETTRRASLGQVASTAIEGLTGARGADIWTPMRQQASEPLKDFLRLQEMRAKGAKPAGVASKPQKSTDPNSPASKRAQMLVKATLGDKFSDDEIAQITEADADNALKYGSLSGQREVTREGHSDANDRAKAALEQGAQRLAQQWKLEWAKMDQGERLAMMRLEEARLKREQDAAQHQQTTQIKLGERNVGGFTIDPTNPPSPEAASKMAEVAVQSTALKQGLDSLEGLYRKSGTEITGDIAGTMAAEWKNLTDLLRNLSKMGVPNGKDYEMLAMQLENPTELRSFLTSKARGLAQMKTVRDQIRRLVEASATAYKYTPQAHKTPITNALPKDASGTPTLDAPAPRRKRDKQGRLWEETPDGGSRLVQ